MWRFQTIQNKTNQIMVLVFLLLLCRLKLLFKWNGWIKYSGVTFWDTGFSKENLHRGCRAESWWLGGFISENSSGLDCLAQNKLNCFPKLFLIWKYHLICFAKQRNFKIYRWSCDLQLFFMWFQNSNNCCINIPNRFCFYSEGKIKNIDHYVHLT